MRKKESQKPAMIALFTAEAIRLMGGPTEGQRRMFRVGATVGRELEPAGVMAGARPHA